MTIWRGRRKIQALELDRGWYRGTGKLQRVRDANMFDLQNVVGLRPISIVHDTD
jgi:hypothetical protein